MPRDLPYPYPTSAGVTAAMKANRRSDTKPEVLLRSRLHRRGFRFRKDMLIQLDGASVRPDIVFTRQRLAVFVDGCFWHGCPEHGHRPRVNTGYWDTKLDRNLQRDENANRRLAEAGWEVIRIWEHTPIPEAVELVVEAADRAASTAG